MENPRCLCVCVWFTDEIARFIHLTNSFPVVITFTDRPNNPLQMAYKFTKGFWFLVCQAWVKFTFGLAYQSNPWSSHDIFKMWLSFMVLSSSVLAFAYYYNHSEPMWTVSEEYKIHNNKPAKELYRTVVNSWISGQQASLWQWCEQLPTIRGYLATYPTYPPAVSPGKKTQISDASWAGCACPLCNWLLTTVTYRNCI